MTESITLDSAMFETGDIISLPYPKLKPFKNMPFLELVERNSYKNYYVVIKSPTLINIKSYKNK